jgi:hypothetical protein
LCSNLGIGIHAFQADDFKSPLALITAVNGALKGVPDLGSSVAKAAPLRIKELDELTKSPDLGKVLFGRGSVFEGRTGPDYQDALAGKKPLSEAAPNSAGAPISQGNRPTQDDKEQKSTTQCSVCVIVEVGKTNRRHAEIRQRHAH